MPIAGTIPVIPHSPQIFGDQTTPVTVGLPNGGYVVAWSDAFSGNQRDVKFQIYNNLGEPVGGVQSANTTTAGEQILRDAVVTADGKFTLVWSTANTLTARTFDIATGAAISAEQNILTGTGNPVNGAQAIVTGSNTIKIAFSSLDTSAAATVLEQVPFNTGTATFGGKTTAPFLLNGMSIVDLDPGNGADQFALLTTGATPVLVANNGSSISLPANVGSVSKIQENVHLLFTEGTNGTLTFHTLTGFGASISGYALSNPIIIGGVAPGNTGQDILAKETVDLGGGRILILWVAETGTGANTNPDGVYGIVFNTATNTFEDSFVRLANLQGTLSETTLDARLMADGRVSLVIGTPTPGFQTFAGKDVLSVIVDPRIAGVSFTGTAQADRFLGSGFADTFTNIGANDVVNGGAGIDSVSLALNEARTIDLVDPARFAAAPSNLSNIEVITMGDLDDVLYGFTTSDTVNGGGGNDTLKLRDGADTVDGGNGNDTIFGAAGNDNLKGGAGNDVISGGIDNDTLDGGADIDNITGGDGNDFIIAGDGADKAYGNSGDDTIDGGAGADFISGGTGNDIIFGGLDADSITAGDGDDIIDAGVGNDFINAGSGFNIVDGGVGVDTVTYAQAAPPAGQSGLFIDLDPSTDPFGNMDGLQAEDDILTNVENVFGSSGNDFIYGNALANTLRGLGGDDTLMGRGGADVLIGGAGNDRFVFEAPGTAGDLIRDFTIGEDTLVFVSSAFGNINAGNIAASFVSNAGGTASIAGAQFVFDNAGADAGRLLFDADGTGAGVASLIATITFTTAGGVAAFSASEFLFV